MNGESTNSNVPEEHHNFLLPYLHLIIDVESRASIQDELKEQLSEWAEKITWNFDSASRKPVKRPFINRQHFPSGKQNGRFLQLRGWMLGILPMRLT